MNHTYRAARIFGQLAFCGLLLAVAIAPRGALAQTVLRWHFTPGQELQQTMVQEMTINMSIGGQDLKTVMNQTVDGVWKITAVDDEGTAAMIQTINRMRMTLEGPGIDLRIDTDSDEELEGMAREIGEALKKLVNAEFQLKMNAQGEVLDVTIPEGVTRALEEMPGAASLADTFSEEGMKNMITQGTPNLPKEGVEEGTTWSRELSMKVPPAGTMNVVSTYTYAGVEGENPPLHKLTVDLKQTIEAEEGGMQIELKDQKTEGAIYFDNEAGRMTRSHIKQAMTLEISVAGQTLEQQIDQTIKVSFTPAP